MQFIIGEPEILQAVREHLAAKGYRVDERTPYFVYGGYDGLLGQLEEIRITFDFGAQIPQQICVQCGFIGPGEQCPVCRGDSMVEETNGG